MIRAFIIFISITLSILACVDPPSKSKKDKANRPTANPVKISNDEAEEESEIIDPAYLTKATALIENTSPVDIKKVDAAKLFRSYCATCHGMRGNMEVNGSKDLTKTNTSVEGRVAQIYYGKGTMTPFKGLLDDAEIIALANYIEELNK